MTISQSELELLIQAADSDPEDSAIQVAAAYALDSFGSEDQAMVYYDRAFQLGPPHDERADFLLGYGSTLKNVGRLEESEGVLSAAVQEFPGHQALPVFLALTHLALGKGARAVSGLLQHLLDCATEAPQLQSYAKAIEGYVAELEKQ